LTSDTCPNGIISDTQACHEAVAEIASVSSTSTVSNASLPSGCIMSPDGANTYQAIYNTAKSTQQCGHDGGSLGPFTWHGPVNATQLGCAATGGCLPSDPKYKCTGEFKGQCTWDSVAVAQAQCSLYDQCEGFYCTSTFEKKFLCFGRSNTHVTSSTEKIDQTWTKIYAKNRHLVGDSTLGDGVTLSVSHDGVTALMTLVGPAEVWFGVGFNAAAMKDLPYAIIVDGKGAVTERKMVDHGPGTLLNASLTVVESSVANGVRTVKITRPVSSLTKDHYALPTTPGEINMITAIGNTPELAYHKSRTGAKLVLLPTNTSSCLCKPTVQKYLTYMNTSTRAFGGYNCYDEPRSDMLKHGDGTGRNVANMACEMETYHGGLQCCQHTFFLTDLAQDSLIPNKTDTYFLKWRYYFQEYEPAVPATPATPVTPASHGHLHHWVFLIDQQVNDYEEDNAHYGTASIGKITAHVTGATMGLEDVPKTYNKIIPYVMTPHCHAPSCIREELWNADTGEIICNVSAVYGGPQHGGMLDAFNELNYVSIPPCIYGAQPGLQTPFAITAKTNITAIKYFNNTYRHLGQMAQWTGLMKYDTDVY